MKIIRRYRVYEFSFTTVFNFLKRKKAKKKKNIILGRNERIFWLENRIKRNNVAVS